MEQISLEDKVSETLGWLANQIACIQVYKKWDEEFKKESLNNAWQKVQEQFKKDIDWNALTESQCKTHVLFKNGYNKDSPQIEKEIESITIGKPKKGLCPDKWLDHDFFIIKFK